MSAHSVISSLIILTFCHSGQAQDLEWVAPITGTDESEGYSIAVDGAGNVYTIGTFEGTQDFDPGPGERVLTAAGANDVYATKHDAQGDLEWAYQLGGGAGTSEWGRGIAVDAFGAVYLTGAFSGACDVDPGPAVVELIGSSNGTGFLVKLNTDGSFAWAKRMGMGGSGRGHAVAVDADDQVYCTGFTNGEAVFQFGSDEVTVQGNGNWCYVYKVDPTGTTGWVRRTAGNDGQALAIDPDGNIHVAGMFSGTTDLDPGPAILPAISAGGPDIHVSKLTSTGDLIWAKAMGGTGEDWVLGLALDASGNVYCTGHFAATVDFDPGPGVLELTGTTGVDTYLLKLDADGDLDWVHGFGGTSSGSSYDNGYGVTCDAFGNVYACGTFTGTIDFDPGPGLAEVSAVQQGDMYLAVYSGSGAFVRALSFGGTNFDSARSVQVSGPGDVLHLTGSFTGTVDFDPSEDVHTLTATAGDAYVLKLDLGSINNVPEASEPFIAIWPNPGTGDLALNLPPGVHLVRLFDASGRVVLTDRLVGSSASIRTTHLAAGIYTVHVDGLPPVQWLRQ